MSIKNSSAGFWLVIAVTIGHLALGEETSSRKVEVKLTGIVLTSDHRCSEAHAEDDLGCRSSDWALDSGRTTYLLYGDKTTLKRFERKRVSVSGVLGQEPILEYGMHMIRRKIAVRSIESSELTKQAIEALMNELKIVPWRGPENHCSDMCWDFAFTDPMIQILQAGRGAQQILVDHISDPEIRDQIVMLLGGVGDEKAIWSIIDTLADGSEATSDLKVKRMNLIGNLALTNLTVGEVIWHHGGGISINRCPTTPKSCWSQWWLEQKDTFKVGIGGDRLYSNYPNYGIYAQFEDSAP